MLLQKKMLKNILRNISKQLLENKYTLNSGQLLWAILDIKRYILTWYHKKFTKINNCINCHWSLNGNNIGSSKENFIEDVFLNGGYGVNIIMKNLKV